MQKASIVAGTAHSILVEIGTPGLLTQQPHTPERTEAFRAGSWSPPRRPVGPLSSLQCQAVTKAKCEQAIKDGPCGLHSLAQSRGMAAVIRDAKSACNVFKLSLGGTL